MFIKTIIKTDKNTGKIYNYYRLCESYRIGNKVRHKTVISIGKLDQITEAGERKLLADRIEELYKGIGNIFDTTLPPHVEQLARSISQKIKRNLLHSAAIPVLPAVEKEYHTIDLQSLKHEDVREVGTEWLCKQAIGELGIGEYLQTRGWNAEMISTSLVHIIGKAVFPSSEHKMAQWIKDNTSVAELFAMSPDQISRFILYRSARRLYGEKSGLENYLSKKTNELFDLQDKIVLYDLTNSYFEGRKDQSRLARFGRSKEKRSDCKLVTLAMVVNVEGFLKYSSIYQGNIADCKTLSALVAELSANTSFTFRKPLIVMDAGIASEENLAMLRQSGYDYLCITRSKLKSYHVVSNQPVTIFDNRQHKITVQIISNPANSDTYLHVHSSQKQVKEESMQTHFDQRYEEELNNIAASVHKKGGTKRYEKVLERIGRLKERYPSANKHYGIDVKAEKGVVTQVSWKRKTLKSSSAEGEYFIRTTVNSTDESVIWDIYNTIREIEASFRTLKTDLSLRPVFHILDQNTMAHLFLGVLAYVIVSTIRYRLKQNGIYHDWRNIVRIMNTQKMVTTTMTNDKGRQIGVRKCSLPTAEALRIYQAMGFKSMPLYVKKFVLPQK